MISVRGDAGRILIGKQLLPQTGEKCQALGFFGQCSIITDANVGPLLADRVKQSVESAGFRSMTITIRAGEKSKTFKLAGTICDAMITAGLDRDGFLIVRKDDGTDTLILAGGVRAAGA